MFSIAILPLVLSRPKLKIRIALCLEVKDGRTVKGVSFVGVHDAAVLEAAG